MPSPKLKPPRKTTRERSLEACRLAMSLMSQVANAIAAAELLQRDQDDDPTVEELLDAARLIVTQEFTTAIAIAGRLPSGTGKDLQFWKHLGTRLEKANDDVEVAVAAINLKQ